MNPAQLDAWLSDRADARKDEAHEAPDPADAGLEPDPEDEDEFFKHLAQLGILDTHEPPA